MVALLLLLLAAGCTTTGDLLPGNADTPPTGHVAQVSTTWHNQVIFAPDPARGGTMSPGLVGRLYLFGPNMGYPLAGDGEVVVDLFDPSQKGEDGGPKFLERWILHQDVLKNCLRRDTIGWGYTLLLPWGTYRPDVTQLVMKARYDPPKAAPIYAQPNTVSLNPVQDFQVTRSSRPIGSTASGVVQASHAAPTGNPGR